MKLPIGATIAWRYLISKKTHGAVGTISTVSVCALAVATAAIVCVLSVFNGFREVIGQRLDSLSPDVMVTPEKGKVFANGDSLAAVIGKMAEVELATATVSDNALVICNGREMPVSLKGVTPEEYARVTEIRKIIPQDYGSYLKQDSAAADEYAGVAEAVLAVGTASRVGAYPESGAVIFAPRREGRVNLANPVSSFLTDSIRVAGVYRAEQSQYDDDGLIVPIEVARRLFMYDRQASAIEVKLRPGVSAERGESLIATALGDGYTVKSRYRQQEMNFRMVNIEKWVSFLLLVFILVIAGFNIISALSMLVIEKEESIGTLSALGMSRRRIGEVFAWESLYVTAAGVLAGMLLGLVLCLLQQHFGLIKISSDPSAVIVTAYPVKVMAADFLVILMPVALLGLVTSVISATFARTKVAESCKI